MSKNINEDVEKIEERIIIEENKCVRPIVNETDQLLDVKINICGVDYLAELFERIKFTKYHFFLILSIFLIKSVEGTEVLNLSICSVMIEKNFGLEKDSSSLINVIILSGNFIGCILSMLISNKFNRKFFIKIGAVLIIIFGFCSILSDKIILFIICRHIVNIGIGFLFAGAISLVTESMNSNYRGFVLNLILVSGSFGEIFISLFIGTIINFDNAHEWRKLFILALAPVYYKL